MLRSGLFTSARSGINNAIMPKKPAPKKSAPKKPAARPKAVATAKASAISPDALAKAKALEKLDAAAGGPLADQGAVQREAAGRWLLEHEPVLAATLAGLVVACYYRDDRVMRSLGLEPRPPYPQGFEVEPGDYASLLEPVRARGRLWRDHE